MICKRHREKLGFIKKDSQKLSCQICVDENIDVPFSIVSEELILNYASKLRENILKIKNAAI